VSTNAWPVWRIVCLALMLTACSATSDQHVLRHLVIAELIERENVSESHIRIEDIHIESHRAIVRVVVRGHGGRLGSERTCRCELHREADRWVMRSAQRMDAMK
jgi:hypothetical protein